MRINYITDPEEQKKIFKQMILNIQKNISPKIISREDNEDAGL